MLRSELFVTFNRPPGWTRTEAPSAPVLFCRIDATSNRAEAGAAGAGDEGTWDDSVACMPSATSVLATRRVVFMSGYNERRRKRLTGMARDDLGGWRLRPR